MDCSHRNPIGWSEDSDYFGGVIATVGPDRIIEVLH
jgi:hypothetical protein